MTESENFKIAIEQVLEHEGGLSDNKHDPGGITNYGISLRYLQSLPDLEGDIDRDGDVDSDDIKIMSEAGARKFYRKNFWDKYHYDQIRNPGVATKIMDMSVNMGPSQAHKIAQRALRAVGVLIKEDGVLGPISFRSINTAYPTFYIPALRCEQAGFYRSLVMRNAALRRAGVKKDDGSKYEDFSTFLEGWLNRAYS